MTPQPRGRDLGWRKLSLSKRLLAKKLLAVFHGGFFTIPRKGLVAFSCLASLATGYENIDTTSSCGTTSPEYY
eukprot:g72987.t1